jgi:hypothetical protein
MRGGGGYVLTVPALYVYPLWCVLTLVVGRVFRSLVPLVSESHVARIILRWSV